MLSSTVEAPAAMFMDVAGVRMSYPSAPAAHAQSLRGVHWTSAGPRLGLRNAEFLWMFKF